MNFARTIATLAVICLVAGCDQPNATVSDGTHVHADGTVHKDHDQSDNDVGSRTGNAHPAAGPNHGHLFAFESEFQGEWLTYNSNDMVRIYILDATGKESAPVTATVVVTAKDGSEFELDPENPDDDGKTAVYVLENSVLSIAMNLGVTVNMKMDDKNLTATIMPHKH